MSFFLLVVPVGSYVIVIRSIPTKDHSATSKFFSERSSELCYYINKKLRTSYPTVLKGPPDVRWGGDLKMHCHVLTPQVVASIVGIPVR